MTDRFNRESVCVHVCWGKGGGVRNSNYQMNDCICEQDSWLFSFLFYLADWLLPTATADSRLRPAIHAMRSSIFLRNPPLPPLFILFRFTLLVYP